MVEKSKPKGEIKYAFSLDNFQKEAKKSILESEITVVNGQAGSGKTSVVAQACLDLLFKKEVKKIWVTRPTIEVGATLGLLPGELKDKLDPYLQPIIDAMNKVYPHPDKIKKHLDKKDIEGTAIQFIRGKTIGAGEVLIIDEAQNTTKHQMLALITRIGNGGKIIIVGDTNQKDIKDSFAGLDYVLGMSKVVKEIQVHNLKGNHRSPLVAKILEFEYGKP